MKSVLDILKFGRRKSIPQIWCGKWVDKNGKQLIIESTKHDFHLVTILNQQGEPFEIELLNQKIKKTEKLIGRFSIDHENQSVLQVEAGTDEIGPTFNLYFLTETKKGLRSARNADNLKDLIIRPNVGIGLYDDYEDDLGVPWAFPLEDFKRKEK